MLFFWILITIANGYYAITLWPSISGVISLGCALYGLWAISKRLTARPPTQE